jgi:RimJ/RimL family protein N-acetyltransferase
LISELTDRAALEKILAKNRRLHIYELGDLDPFFFPHTRWFTHEDALCLLYSGSFGSTLLAFAEPHTEAAMRALLSAAAEKLPPKLYIHLTPGLAAALAPKYELDEAEPHLKMALLDREKIKRADTDGVVAIGPEDLESVEALYRHDYPGNWFDARMLETGCYFGIRGEDDRWLAIAGVHVYSPSYRVAALGNIVTARVARGRGLGTKVTAAACKKLLREVEVIGLNVLADNAAAIACYEKLGFEAIAEYEERAARAR